MATSSNNRGAERHTLLSYFLQNSWQTVQFGLRSTTLICSVFFFFLGFGVSPGQAYRMYLNVMMSSFFVFTIRFYIRLKEAQVSMFSRQFLQFFPTEDSGHYLIYTLLFYNQPPTTIFVLPMFLYSLLFSVKFIRGLVEFLPTFTQSYINVCLRTVANKQADIHRFIAFCEVFIIIILIWKALTGNAFILAPFLYYQFLKLRYLSRRNGSVRTVFSELHMSANYAASHPRCPALVSSVIQKAVLLISRLNPMPPGMANNPQNPS